jgi:hypothetical protein
MDDVLLEADEHLRGGLAADAAVDVRSGHVCAFAGLTSSLSPALIAGLIRVPAMCDSVRVRLGGLPGRRFRCRPSGPSRR